jgi:hypothetical protein
MAFHLSSVRDQMNLTEFNDISCTILAWNNDLSSRHEWTNILKDEPEWVFPQGTQDSGLKLPDPPHFDALALACLLLLSVLTLYLGNVFDTQTWHDPRLFG